MVINGTGAAGIAIARALRCISLDPDVCIPVKKVLICDSKGIIHCERNDLSYVKSELLRYSNPEHVSGTLQDAIVGADVFIGVSKGNLLKAEDIYRMNKDAVVFALANPVPEIFPDEVIRGGAAIIAIGRSDFPNQDYTKCFKSGNSRKGG